MLFRSPKNDTPSSGGDSSVWTQLLDQYKGRLAIPHRVFLNMATGILDGDCLTVWCRDDFAKTSLDNTTILTVLREVTSAAVGQSIRVELKVGKAPQATATAAPRPAAPAPRPAPVQEAAPAQIPPWEDSVSASRDRLDELMGPAQKLDNFKIK